MLLFSTPSENGGARTLSSHPSPGLTFSSLCISCLTPSQIAQAAPYLWSLQSTGEMLQIHTRSTKGCKEVYPNAGGVYTGQQDVGRLHFSAIYLLFQNCMTLNMAHIYSTHTPESFVLFCTSSVHPLGLSLKSETKTKLRQVKHLSFKVPHSHTPLCISHFFELFLKDSLPDSISSRPTSACICPNMAT